MNYEVYPLDLNCKMAHIEGGEPLLATDDMGEAQVYIHDQFVNHGLELCIFMPRLNGYCGFYRKSQKRDRKGRFTKA